MDDDKDAQFYAMIDEALKSPKRPLTDELYEELFDANKLYPKPPIGARPT